MRRCAIAVMAKAPQAGEVKTRLVPPLTPEAAADLYRCLLLDKLLQVGQIPEVDRYVAYTPVEARPVIQELAPPPFALIPQSGADLGDRLHRLSTALLERGHAGAIIVDSDTPNLPSDCLAEALRQLSRDVVDLVLGPAEDGGYYLIGLKRPSRELFDDISWSTPSVLPETLRRASRRRLQTALLPSWYDVDTADDLLRLRRELTANGSASAPHTRAFLFDRQGGRLR